MRQPEGSTYQDAEDGSSLNQMSSLTCCHGQILYSMDEPNKYARIKKLYIFTIFLIMATC